MQTLLCISKKSKKIPHIIITKIFKSYYPNDVLTRHYWISILEKNPGYYKKKQTDHRTLAISEGTKIFFEKIGLWKDINLHVQPIKKITVVRNFSNDKHTNSYTSEPIIFERKVWQLTNN